MSQFSPMPPPRRPRSAARRAQCGLPPRQLQEGPWEDTAVLTTAPEPPSFFSRQPPIFWVVAALLLTAMFVLTGVVAIDAWHAREAERAEALRRQQWEEEEATYKLLFRDFIEDYSYEQGLDPALVAAVIYHESRFDPNAVSSLGARGLMQIMEDTGQWIAEKLNEEEGYTFDLLFNPETNIRFGTWYLGYLSRRFDGDIVKMAAGYHAGQGNVDAWLQNPENSSDGYTLERIPTDDTRQYVQRVVNAYEIYTRHYYAPQPTQEPAEEGA